MMAPLSEGSLLNSLLQYDESLRAGRVPETLVLETDPELLKKVSVGQKALKILEAAVPRRVKAIPSWAPHRIGRFEILSVLGSGGFAVVYLARDPDLNRQIALKVPRPHSLINSDLRRRFVTEAKAVASLDHPNIISVFESGEDGDLPYLACALCEGPTLSEWLTSRKASVSPRLAAEIVRTLTLAVQYSHSRGILHRDIKPGNVFLFPDQSQPGADFPFVPRLGDFGLAKLLEAETAETMTSQLIGTPRYLAPEIIQSSSRSAGEASDIYALGATLYSLLVGRPPFDSSSTPETLRLIVESDPIAPHIIDPGIDQDLSLVCLKCLEKQPEQRYESAASLAEDLARFLSGHPVKARRASLVQTLFKWSRRRPVIALLSLISGCLTVTILVLAVAYTRSLQVLQSNLESTNDQLRRNVTELDGAVRQSEFNRKLADENFQQSERLLFAADVQLASLAWRNGDAQGASRILSKHESPSNGISRHSHFAWNYLRSRISFPNEIVQSSGPAIWWMMESPQAEAILIAGSEGRIKSLSKTSPHVERCSLKATEGELSGIAFSDDAQLMVTTGDNGHLAVWDASSNRLLHSLDDLKAGDISVAVFLRDKHQFLSCGDGPELKLWNADAGTLLQTIRTPHDGSIEHITLSPSRDELLTTGSDGSVFLFPVDGFVPKVRFVLGRQPLTVAQFTPDGKRIVVGGRDGKLRLCDLESGSILTDFAGLDAIHAVACSSRGIVASGDRAGAITLFDSMSIDSDNPPETWIPLSRLGAHQKPISAVLWEKNTSHNVAGPESLLTADRSGVIRKWQFRNRETSRELYEGSDQFDSGPNWMAAGYPSSTDAPTSTIICGGQHIAGLSVTDSGPGNSGPHFQSEQIFSAVAQPCNSQEIVAGNSDGQVFIFRDHNKTDPVSFDVFDRNPIDNLSVDDFGQFSVILGGDGELAVLDLRDGNIPLRLTDQAAAAISPDGSRIVSASHGSNILQVRRLQNLNADPEAELSSHHTTVSAILFTSDGRQIISVSHDRTVCVWDCDTWALRHRLTGHLGKIRAAAISPNNLTVATGDDNGSIKLWDVMVGRELLEIEPLPLDSITGMLFTRDGSSLVVWDHNCHAFEILSRPEQ